VLLHGDALAISERQRFTIKAAGSLLSVTGGAVRLGRQLGVEAAVYRGQVAISSAGHTLTVPALREAVVPALGVVPPKAEPLRLRATDAWDRRFLGDAIELTDQLQARSDGLTGQL